MFLAKVWLVFRCKLYLKPMVICLLQLVLHIAVATVDFFFKPGMPDQVSGRTSWAGHNLVIGRAEFLIYIILIIDRRLPGPTGGVTLFLKYWLTCLTFYQGCMSSVVFSSGWEWTVHFEFYWKGCPSPHPPPLPFFPSSCLFPNALVRGHLFHHYVYHVTFLPFFFCTHS